MNYFLFYKKIILIGVMSVFLLTSQSFLLLWADSPQTFLSPEIDVNTRFSSSDDTVSKLIVPVSGGSDAAEHIHPAVNSTASKILEPETQENKSNLEPVRLNPSQVATELRTGISVSDVTSVELDPVMIVNLIASDNLDVGISKALIDQYKWRVPYVGSQLLPSVQGSYIIDKLTGATVILDQTPISIRRLNQKPSMNINYRFTPRTIMDIKAAHAQYKRSQSQYERTLQTQLLNALQQYYKWLRDISANDVAKLSLEEAASQRRQNEIRFDAGFGTQLDIEQASVLEAERKSDVLTTENKQIMSGVELASVLNVPLEYPIFPKEDRLTAMSYASILVEKPLNELFSMAEKNRPDLKDLSYLVKEAKATFWADLSEALPTVTANANFGATGPQKGQFNRSFQRNVSVEANLLNNLGLGLFSRAKMDKARIKEAILTKEKEVVTIKNAITKAYFDLKLYQQQVDVMAQKMKSATSALKITHARQQHGVGIHLEVIQAETKLAEARQEYLDAVMQYNNAQLQLMFEVGELTPDRVLVAVQLNHLPEDTEVISTSIPSKPAQTKVNSTENQANPVVTTLAVGETSDEKLSEVMLPLAGSSEE